MTTSPENSQFSASKSLEQSPKSVTTSAAERPNPFQGLGSEDAWQRLLAQPGRVVTREEMIRRVQEQAAARKQQ